MLKLRKRRMWRGVLMLLTMTTVGATVAAGPAAADIAQDVANAQARITTAVGKFPSTHQVITVSAASAGSTTSTLIAWQYTGTQWQAVAGPVPGYLGAQGVGAPADNVPRTPAGAFSLTQSFGRLANPGAKLPYFQATTQDWWDSNLQSPTYNQHVRGVASPGGDSENLYNSGPVYDYAVVINHNPQNIRGQATAMFLHVANGSPTEGCVAIDKATLVKILQWLDPAQAPTISIAAN